MFFGSASLEMVYVEAVANALDAGATEIDIEIAMQADNKPETLSLRIADNGVGFTDERYKKFCNLFDVQESTHKGVGRLVYLSYFDSIDVVSFFDNDRKRTFTFTEDFNESKARIDDGQVGMGTVLSMNGYLLGKIAKRDYVQPEALKKRLLQEFYVRLFDLCRSGQQIRISVKASIDGDKTSSELSNKDIPNFEHKDLKGINLFDRLKLYYAIRKVSGQIPSFMAAMVVDQRTVEIDLLAKENIPVDYEMVFLLYSDSLKGKTDAARQSLIIPTDTLRQLEMVFRQEVITIIEELVPEVPHRNSKLKEGVARQFPHLSGYLDTHNIGYVSKTDILKRAQDAFFKDQRELLEAESLNEEQYGKSLEVAARSLTEYILFRQVTIRALKQTTRENSEAELHKLFAPMRKEGRLEQADAVYDLYRNNAWLLDDKYMTYETLLSDREMGELVSVITQGEEMSDVDRPDIALIFSRDPDKGAPFDVVIVELKKRGISLEENMKVVTQLEKRARKLMQHYQNRIQRIWFYGIIEFNEEVELALAGEYKELYSAGKMYYRETSIAISLNPTIAVPVGIFIWDLDAVVKDAELRNAAFLNLLKSKFSGNI